MTTTLGFYGKLPSHGDFVARGLAHGFTETWDAWLQQGIATSKAALGDDWLNVYLTSPIWRFVLNPNICGARGWAGVLVPSVDRVGRYFPLTIACTVAEDTVPLQVVTGAGNWLSEVESVALRALSDDTMDADKLALAIAEIGSVDLGAGRVSVIDAPPAALPSAGLHIPFADESSPGQGTLVLAHRLIQANCGVGYTLWWTGGSDRVRPGLMACGGLPDANAYSALLDERFIPMSWQRFAGYEYRAERPSVDLPGAEAPVPPQSVDVAAPPPASISEPSIPGPSTPAGAPPAVGAPPPVGAPPAAAPPAPVAAPPAVGAPPPAGPPPYAHNPAQGIGQAPLPPVQPSGNLDPLAAFDATPESSPGGSSGADLPPPVAHGDIEPIEVTAARIADEVAAAARAADTTATNVPEPAPEEQGDDDDTLVPALDALESKVAEDDDTRTPPVPGGAEPSEGDAMMAAKAAGPATTSTDQDDEGEHDDVDETRPKDEQP